MASAFESLPSVSALLLDPAVIRGAKRYGRPLMLAAIRGRLQAARDSMRAGGVPPSFTGDSIVREAQRLRAAKLRPVINATGVMVHTNLGRAPLSARAVDAVTQVARGYNNLEYDLDTGERGSRHAHARALLTELLGAEDAVAVNNCAGAVLLMLAAQVGDGRREVIVSRGELVEIGGGFRVPDVLRQSGATLVEVGTTNKVHLSDYAAAITEETAAILVVHRSNFAIVGFTAQPQTSELAALSKRHDLPLLVDVGSGLIADDEALGASAPFVGTEPRPQDVLSSGADLVAFSGDKLLGGPQAGVLAGKAILIERISKHPLARALRLDKMSLAALEATLRDYREGTAERVPIISQLRSDRKTLEDRATTIEAALEDCTGLEVTRSAVDSVVGGGALPLSQMASIGLLLRCGDQPAGRLLDALRRGDPPVIARIIDDHVAIDVRTVADGEAGVLACAIKNAVYCLQGEYSSG